jgi:cytoskeleton protein RodZ
MSKHKKRKTQKGRTDGQSTLAANELSVAMHDAQQPIQSCAVNNPDMNTPKDISPDSEETGRSASAEADHMDFRLGQSPPPADVQRESLGQRLRAAREARGWSDADVASRLHLPIQIVQTLEADRFDAIGHRIYLRGYLTSYVRLLDLPTVLVDTVLQQHQQNIAPPPLTTTGTISHSRYLFQRYSVSALYLILTGVIIVPAVLLAMRAGLEPKITDLTSLDAPNVAGTSESAKSNVQPTASAPAANSAPEAAAPATAPNAGAAPESPLVASMAPFQALAHKESEVAQPSPPASVSGSGAHTLRLSLKEASWVEVTSASGEKLEYGLLPAGTVRTISSDSVLDVRVGNSGGAQVELDGQMQDLTPYRHSNVAHFKAFAAGQPISPY